MFRYQLILPLSILSTSGLTIWYYLYNKNVNSQKYGSHLFKAIMFNLRQNPFVQSEMGKIEFDKKNIVDGHINMIRGDAEIEFPVSGEKGNGTVHFKGKKMNLGSQWNSEIFTLKLDKGKTIELQ